MIDTPEILTYFDKSEINLKRNLIENYPTAENNNVETRRDTHSQSPKLYQKISEKTNKGSFSYNVMILSVFNINIGKIKKIKKVHFCFPYLIHKTSFYLYIIVMIFTSFMAYFIHNSLILFLAKEESECQVINYSVIIEKNLGRICAKFVDFLVIIWFSNLLIILFMTSKNLINNLTNDLIYYEIAVYILLMIIFYIINMIDEMKIIYFDLIFGCFNHFFTIIVTFKNYIF